VGAEGEARASGCAAARGAPVDWMVPGMDVAAVVRRAGGGLGGSGWSWRFPDAAGAASERAGGPCAPDAEWRPRAGAAAEEEEKEEEEEEEEEEGLGGGAAGVCRVLAGRGARGAGRAAPLELVIAGGAESRALFLTLAALFAGRGCVRGAAGAGAAELFIDHGGWRAAHEDTADEDGTCGAESGGGVGPEGNRTMAWVGAARAGDGAWEARACGGALLLRFLDDGGARDPARAAARAAEAARGAAARGAALLLLAGMPLPEVGSFDFRHIAPLALPPARAAAAYARALVAAFRSPRGAWAAAADTGLPAALVLMTLEPLPPYGGAGGGGPGLGGSLAAAPNVAVAQLNAALLAGARAALGAGAAGGGGGGCGSGGGGGTTGDVAVLDAFEMAAGRGGRCGAGGLWGAGVQRAKAEVALRVLARLAARAAAEPPRRALPRAAPASPAPAPAPEPHALGGCGAPGARAGLWWRPERDGTRTLHARGCRMRRFSRDAAHACLRGRHLLLIGDSVTRWLRPASN
jgi:hypothetical protein